MGSLAHHLKPELATFAKELLAAGFKVYLFKRDVANGRVNMTSFGFSREVDGKTCYASVQEDLLSYSFNMPIKPSRQHGSGMFIEKSERSWGDAELLTVGNAELYASPTGHNNLVGTHQNYGGTYYGENGIYQEVTA